MPPRAREAGREPDELAELFSGLGAGTLTDHLGMRWTAVAHGLVRGTMPVSPVHMAGNGYLHAGAVVALADNACGYGCVAALPNGAVGFTTVELKANLLGTAMDGAVEVEARVGHEGLTTRVWDAAVRRANETKPIALFRCTQLILYPAKRERDAT